MLPLWLLGLLACELEFLVTVFLFVLYALEVVLLDADVRDVTDFTLLFELGLFLITFLLLATGFAFVAEVRLAVFALLFLVEEIFLEIVLALLLSKFPLLAKGVLFNVLPRLPDSDTIVFLRLGL